ncbi:MAG: alpha/beta fold hydrolase [Chloroflexota bacterium]|nr:alpha/beta fold hydrolase [Chloroflexota bacterium]
MIEKEITFSSGEAQLAGTLCMPEDDGQFPCVLMIHGSGPVDRDENAPHARIDAFNTIAHHLAGKGVASLRYDKRGCGKSGGIFDQTGFYDLAQDGMAAYRYLTSQDRIDKDKVFILGHSEGSMIAPRIHLSYTAVSGLILIGVQARKLEEGLKYQARMIIEDVKHGSGFTRFAARIAWKILRYDPLKTQKVLFERVRRTDKDSFRYKGQKINAKWLREHLEYDPVYTMRNVSCPILAITGDKDIQVDPQDAALVAELAKGEVEYHIVPNLTHILRTDGGPPSIFNYKHLLKQPMDERVLQIIDDWLQKRLR